MNKLIKVVNEDRLLALLPYFFENPESVVVEIAQNASRAGATKLDIELKENILTATDNGRGTDNPEALIVLADSDWSAEVEAQQMPAGWGLSFLHCIAERVTYTSNFGTLEVDCDRFIKDRHYRENILGSIRTDNRCKGFRLEAVLKNGTNEKILSKGGDMLSYFPLDVAVNGKPVDKKQVKDWHKNGFDLATEYEGNPVYSNVDFLRRGIDDLEDNLFAVWYGIPIKEPYWKTGVAIDVKTGSPLTPVLPYRNAVKHDEKLERFYNFLRKKAADFCVEKINDRNISDKWTLLKYMRVIESIGTKEELNRLERFYVKADEPYHSSPNGVSRIEAIVNKDEEAPVNEEVKIRGLKKVLKCNSEDDTGGIFFEEGVFKEVRAPSNSPAWLKIKTKKYIVDIRLVAKGKYEGNMTWRKVRIKSEKKFGVIGVAGVTDDNNGICILYTDKPDSVWGIDDVMFDNVRYSDEGDTWDTQKDCFDKDLHADIAEITGCYDIQEILGGLYNLGVAPCDVKSIKLSKNTMLIKTKKGSKTVALSA